jgi:DNA polymerase V
MPENPMARFWPQPAYAGFPNPANDYIEPDLNLHDLIVQHPLTTYFIKVSGDSMSGACICSGDVVVVDRALTVTPNAIVVARVGEHLLLKRVKMRQRKIYLYPDPPGDLVIQLGKSDDIFGVVTHCIHRTQ